MLKRACTCAALLTVLVILGLPIAQARAGHTTQLAVSKFSPHLIGR